MPKICPRCGELSDADWPLTMPDGSVQDGGCQLCWERECGETWWALVSAIEEADDADET